MSELKKCPFCGSEAEVVWERKERDYGARELYKVPDYAVFLYKYTVPKRVRYERTAEQGRVPVIEQRERYKYETKLVTVTCSNSSCMARQLSRKVPSYERAAERWNTRAEEV